MTEEEIAKTGVVKARKEDNQYYLSVKSRRKTQWLPLDFIFL